MKFFKMFMVALVAVFAFSSVAQATQPNNNGNGKGEGHTPVTICHKPGTPAQQTLVVDDDSVKLNGHLGHGDTRGACTTVVVPPDEPPVDEPPVDNPDEPVVTPDEPTDTTPDATPPPVKKEKKAEKKKDKQETGTPVTQNNGGGPAAPVAKPAPEVSSVTTSGTLPYTGLSAGLLFGMGAFALIAGLLLWRKVAIN